MIVITWGGAAWLLGVVGDDGRPTDHRGVADHPIIDHRRNVPFQAFVGAGDGGGVRQPHLPSRIHSALVRKNGQDLGVVVVGRDAVVHVAPAVVQRRGVAQVAAADVTTVDAVSVQRPAYLRGMRRGRRVEHFRSVVQALCAEGVPPEVRLPPAGAHLHMGDRRGGRWV